ncbi:hypothetical protein CBR_g530 [Chara braunii]|uniref:Uncharacterized protein n=1 Tax=Chara braunii TaxID=69332 RepID=A0A388KBR2_CHABU|nr:hypothetical protein CBR_g530 [Chara braunii]|eukprot:GBG67393.1 hypothetical protein CBR_g530 [Chara braunii]
MDRAILERILRDVAAVFSNGEDFGAVWNTITAIARFLGGVAELRELAQQILDQWERVSYEYSNEKVREDNADLQGMVGKVSDMVSDLRERRSEEVENWEEEVAEFERVARDAAQHVESWRPQSESSRTMTEMLWSAIRHDGKSPAAREHLRKNAEYKVKLQTAMNMLPVMDTCCGSEEYTNFLWREAANRKSDLAGNKRRRLDKDAAAVAATSGELAGTPGRKDDERLDQEATGRLSIDGSSPLGAASWDRDQLLRSRVHVDVHDCMQKAIALGSRSSSQLSAEVRIRDAKGAFQGGDAAGRGGGGGGRGGGCRGGGGEEGGGGGGRGGGRVGVLGGEEHEEEEDEGRWIAVGESFRMRNMHPIQIEMTWTGDFYFYIFVSRSKKMYSNSKIVTLAYPAADQDNHLSATHRYPHS